MGVWAWQCTTTGLDNSIELRTKKIHQAVTEIWVPQVWQPPAQPPARPPASPPARPPARTVTTIPLQPGGLRGKKWLMWGINSKKRNKGIDFWLGDCFPCCDVIMMDKCVAALPLQKTSMNGFYFSHSLKRKCRHFDEIFVTGGTESCHFDNFRCSQWWKFHRNDDISVSVLRPGGVFQKCIRALKSKSS